MVEAGLGRQKLELIGAVGQYFKFMIHKLVIMLHLPLDVGEQYLSALVAQIKPNYFNYF
jgi:hypothetical protein